MRASTLFATALLPFASALAACGAPSSGVAVETLWAEHCQRCHSTDGRGQPAQRPLDPRVDLTASELVRAGDRGLAYRRIAYGYGTMPGFSHKLERGDLEKLAEYALALGKR
jgi:mono/diheme cytochrome c family protein